MVHVTVCVIMILVVLLQAGKGAEMGAAFGGSSKTVFGPRGAAGPLAKVTIAAATLFMLTSLYLTWASKHMRAPSLVDNVKPPAAATETTTPPVSPEAPGAPTVPEIPDVPEVPATPATPSTPAAPVAPAPEGGGAPAPAQPESDSP